MKGIFTILNYYFSPGRWAAQWPLTTAPAAVGDRNLQKRLWIYSLDCKIDTEIQPILSSHVETVVLLSKLNTKQHIEVELNLDELDLTSAESKATYEEIKAYVLEKHGLKVSSLYISQVKRKCGLDVGQNYNLSKKEDAKVPQCPPEKEAAIMEALKYFQMI